jgi:hypothetical protein
MGVKTPKIRTSPFLWKKKNETNCMNLGVCQDLMKFTKIHMPESLK